MNATPSSRTLALSERPSLWLRLRQRIARLTLHSKLTLMTTAVSFFCLLGASAALITHEVYSFRATLLGRSLALADVVAANSEAAVSFEDAAGVQQLLASLAVEPNIREAQVLVPSSGDDGQPVLREFSAYRADPNAAPAQPLDPAIEHRFHADRLELIRPILQEGAPIGYLYLVVDLSQLDQLIARFTLLVVVLLLLSVLFAWLLASRFQRVLTRPVTELMAIARAVSESRDYSQRARVLSQDEFGTLTQAFNAMLQQVQAHDSARAAVEAEIRQLNEGLESKVRERTRALEASNQELHDAIDNLKRAQSQLVESEKMAALGGLVAGVAHEINTPMGIGITAISHLGELVRSLRQGLSEGSLKRSALEHFMHNAEESVAIITRNLERAAELVRSFKQVAVDQTSEVRRRFEVAEYFQEVLLSLRPKLKRTHIEVSLDCDPKLTLDSYPGVLSQILTNLVVNSLLHGFDADARGQIRIRVAVEGNDFVLDYRDDGRGMPLAVRQRIFDPFFTTKRGEGGSGLGMHITYNQVTQTLGGSIVCESEPDQGARFLIRFPYQP